MNTKTINVEADLTPVVQEALDAMLKAWAGPEGKFLRVAALVILVRECIDRLPHTERLAVIDALRTKWRGMN